MMWLAGCGASAAPAASHPVPVDQAGAPVVAPTALPAVAATDVPPLQAAAPSTVAPIRPTPPGAAAPIPTVDDRLPLSRTLNILLLGSDRRPNTPNWRTDVMMIVALDFERHRAGVISIPRDVFLDVIPNHQPNRINVVDYLGEKDEPGGGGPKLLASIIRQRMHISIDHYLRFDFDSFRKVVDALGGVDIEVDCPYYDYFPIEGVVLNVKPGTYHMGGDLALAYVRSRRIGGDLDRARRQQRFAWAVRNQILASNLLPRIPALYAALSGSVDTDIGVIEALRIVRFALSLDESDIHGFVLGPPTLLTSGWRLGMSVFIADWDAIAADVQTVFERPAFSQTSTVGPNGDRQSCP